MARLEPVQTAWAMSNPPSMAKEAREIVDGLILACDNLSHSTGCSKDEVYGFLWSPVVITGSTLYI